jgi:hypothetical protein
MDGLKQRAQPPNNNCAPLTDNIVGLILPKKTTYF